MLKTDETGSIFTEGGFSVPGPIHMYCLPYLYGNSGHQKRFRNGRVTPQLHFINFQLAADMFSSMGSSIVGGFMASGQGGVEPTRACVSGSGSNRVPPLTPDSAPKFICTS
jgi:hypothetical protein